VLFVSPRSENDIEQVLGSHKKESRDWTNSVLFLFPTRTPHTLFPQQSNHQKKFFHIIMESPNAQLIASASQEVLFHVNNVRSTKEDSMRPWSIPFLFRNV